ncbi:hypothetical protein ElyMa_006681400 [Elysia marginata]|uniref:Uncharacterized protein n=1 Tax=Elysia marginata TaxID=1093978 RepID=A0AAV4ITH0_9GAST|nr:hypothetical protein ElyMa_006681400 [Elysia marginata]
MCGQVQGEDSACGRYQVVHFPSTSCPGQPLPTGHCKDCAHSKEDHQKHTGNYTLVEAQDIHCRGCHGNSVAIELHGDCGACIQTEDADVLTFEAARLEISIWGVTALDGMTGKM